MDLKMSSSCCRLMCSLVVVLKVLVGDTVGAPPNFLIVLADDLGFSDIGCYGGEIPTPNLDQLAQNGLRYVQFYNTARCWPTRGSLLTGYYAQQIRRDSLSVETIGPQPPPGPGNRPAWAQLLPAYLRPLGYRSYHSGKWHIDGRPLDGGFDRSYRVDDQDRHFRPTQHSLDDQDLPPVRPEEDYYATTAIATHAIDCLQDHARRHADRPFFQFVAFTCPHFPLQAPVADIARHRQRYEAGWEAVRHSRWQRIRESLGLPGDLSPLEPQIGPSRVSSKGLAILGTREIDHECGWHELSRDQQAFQIEKMAIHAAMVDRMDQEIGRILAQLQAMDSYDNTLVIFCSDNGASAEILVRGEGHEVSAAPGSAGTFLCLGPGWSKACNTPFRRHKIWVHEGGISTPLILRWPAGISDRGTVRHAVGHVIDIGPTFLELAGGTWPTTYQGQPVPAPAGVSLVPTFSEDDFFDRPPLWWLHEGNRAIRVHDWKLVSAAGEPWELYDLSRDRTECHNLAAQHPARVEAMAKLWQSQADAM